MWRVFLEDWPYARPEAIGGRFGRRASIFTSTGHSGEITMATEKQRGSRETKKPKKPVVKTNAAAPSTKNIVSDAVKASGRK
ncbi:hypothetical protein GCM10007887_20420 [Methylobacterium haplocladii]|uniref:Uncharacterized protein n=1 Tax=Methylobacterium haplocladii TaxID=1176176 RepID=A0A512IV25_9HYPH|nr:hypothetical protein MHA02_39420 [Methylobacterium haplocladii]GLS59376.1 hypothetical protein GCM10007887_20420 [Methylobacterium haplocladii]